MSEQLSFIYGIFQSLNYEYSPPKMTLIWLWQARCDATNPKLYQINLTAWGFLGHRGSTNSKLNCHHRSVFTQMSHRRHCFILLPTTKPKSKQVKPPCLFPWLSLAGVCWLSVPWRWSTPGGAGFLQKSHSNIPPSKCLNLSPGPWEEPHFQS